jgi:hypothetical protein
LRIECVSKRIDDVFVHREVRVMVFNATFNNISVISWRALYTEGYRVSEIARILTRPQSTVDDVIDNYLNRENKERKTKTCDDLQLSQTLKTCPIKQKELLM